MEPIICRSPTRQVARFMTIVMTIAVLVAVCHASAVFAFTISFSDADFGTTTTFSDVDTFTFEIEIDAPLQAGVYNNPSLTGVDYSVSGSLEPGTPSMFSAFALNRPETVGDVLPGTEFYGQGSSLYFEIAVGADLSDGVQVVDLVPFTDLALPSIAGPDPLLTDVIGASDPVFMFYGREVEDITGFSRFHPALFVLNSDGTGSMRNANNIVNKNGFTEIDFGAEYVTELTFDPSTTTLSPDTAIVPLPPAVLLFISGLGFVVLRLQR